MGKVSRIPTIGDYTIFFNSLFLSCTVLPFLSAPLDIYNVADALSNERNYLQEFSAVSGFLSTSAFMAKVIPKIGPFIPHPIPNLLSRIALMSDLLNAFWTVKNNYKNAQEFMKMPLSQTLMDILKHRKSIQLIGNSTEGESDLTTAYFDPSITIDFIDFSQIFQDSYPAQGSWTPKGGEITIKPKLTLEMLPNQAGIPYLPQKLKLYGDEVTIVAKDVNAKDIHLLQEGSDQATPAHPYRSIKIE